MGIKHTREYRDITRELVEALTSIEHLYTWFEMEQQDWEGLSAQERLDILDTAADDLFFALSEHESIQVGTATIRHNERSHTIELVDPGRNTLLIHLF